MKRHEYLSPRTSRARIEVESAFCGASVINPNEDNGRINEHSTNTGFGGDFSESGWDIDPTKSPTF